MLRNFFAREELAAHQAEGQTLVEYGLLLALIAAVCVFTVALIGSRANTLFTTISNSI